MNFQLVPMDKSHLKQVAELDKALFARPWSEDIWENELYSTTVSLVVAETEEGEVLGYGALGVILDEGSLERIAVRPDCQRKGIAQAILDAFLRFGEEKLAYIGLEVREGNTPAIGLYEKNGFAQVGRRKNYYSETKEDAILMDRVFRELADLTEGADA